MAYSELIKKFSRIREYMRDFYVFGFKSRDDYTIKSKRSYDDEKRRLESWLGDYMSFKQTPDGKNVFISIDSRITHHNPLYTAWKAKSFTDGDITLHFILMDILKDSEEALSISEIMEDIDGYLDGFEEPRMFDESTVRKKLKEYESVGLVISEKQGKTLFYRISDDSPIYDSDVLDYFSEIMPCGVIGSFLLDKKRGMHEEVFAFKHHYITGALDSEIVCALFMAMQEKKSVSIEVFNRDKDRITETQVIPLRVFISVQSGRQYLLAYSPGFKRFTPFRTDNILSVKLGDEEPRFDEFREKLDSVQKHMWGVSTEGRSGERMEHVEFIITFRDDEKHIPQRLEREKRCGTLERIDDNTYRFSADVFDAMELVPWIRTFICRITDIHFSDEKTERKFREDIEKMYEMYGVEGGDAL